MKIVIIGCGHVGLVSAVGFAELGHQVVGMDSDAQRVELLRHGQPWFFEPGLADLLGKHNGGLVTFETDLHRALEGADAAFICVATPPRPDGRLSLIFVEQATHAIAENASGPLVIVEKSTVPVQTARRIAEVLEMDGKLGDIEVATNPEFLREGHAVRDTLDPDRIVVGVRERGGLAERVLRAIYEPLIDQSGTPLLVTDLETAELIKHASNSFLAMKISYINAVARICERTGADIEEVARGLGLDPRIGPHFLAAGVGYGGSCFPKDLNAFIAQAADVGVSFDILEDVRKINAEQRHHIIDKVKQAIWNIDAKTIAVWGLAFKPDTDDLRDAPSLDVIPALQAEGAHVRAFDPAAAAAAKSEFPDAEICGDAMSAVEGADALVVLTEWREFRSVDLQQLKDALRRPVVVDGRNLWPIEAMAELGFTYLSFGRPDVVAGQVKRPRAHHG
jgi:UDPglucose 6-dehydrogenase